MQFGNYVHARSRTVWAAALIVGTLACGGDSVTSPSGGGGDGDGFNLPANPPLLGGNATTPTVSVVKESGSAAKASIGVDGGTIVAHGASGATFTLTVPAGALLQPTEITVTPVTSMSGNEVAASSVATADLAPSGLEFMRAATLHIDLPTAPTGRVVGIGYSGDGQDFHLMPAVPGTTPQSFDIPVLHFSGNGVSGASAAAIISLAQQIGASAQSRLEQAIGAVLGKKAGEALTAGDIAQITALLGDYYTQVVKPRLVAAQTDDKQLKSAAETYWGWERATELLGLGSAFDAQRSEGRELVITAIVNHYRQSYGRCAQQHNTREIEELIAIIHVMQVMGAADRLPPGDIQTAAGCADMRLEFTSTINFAGGFEVWQTHGEVALPYVIGATSFSTMMGSHSIVSFSSRVTPTCSNSYANTDGQIAVVDFAFERDSAGIKNVRLAYDPHVGGPQSMVTVTCPGLPVPLPAVAHVYGGAFVHFHQDEYLTDPRPAYYVTSGWEPGSGEILWRRRYSRAIDNGTSTEETELVIRHTPRALP